MQASCETGAYLLNTSFYTIPTNLVTDIVKINSVLFMVLQASYGYNRRRT